MTNLWREGNAVRIKFRDSSTMNCAELWNWDFRYVYFYRVLVFFIFYYEMRTSKKKIRNTFHTFFTTIRYHFWVPKIFSYHLTIWKNEGEKLFISGEQKLWKFSFFNEISLYIYYILIKKFSLSCSYKVGLT